MTNVCSMANRTSSDALLLTDRFAAVQLRPRLSDYVECLLNWQPMKKTCDMQGIPRKAMKLCTKFSY